MESLKALEGLNIEGTGSDRNALEGTMSKDHLASQTDFALGYAAMIPNGSWVETEIAKSLDNVYEMAMMPPIALDEAHADSAFWSNNSNHVLIPSASPNVELAKEFLKYVCEHVKKKHVVLAPTGVAAIHVGGSTIHSFFKMPFRPIS